MEFLDLWREHDRQMTGALANPRGAPHGARTEALDGRPLVGMHCLDDEVLADELVVVLGVRDGRLEQLAPILCDRTRRVGQDSSRLLDGLAADVVADQAGLAGR